MIEFATLIEDRRFLRRAVVWARKNKFHILSLSDLDRKRSVDELTTLARSWQKAGLGTLIEVSEEGRRSVHFSLNDAALTTVDAAYQQSLTGRMRSVPTSDRIALAALIVSLIALFK